MSTLEDTIRQIVREELHAAAVTLRRLRRSKGLDQHALAERAGVSRSCISHIELGQSRDTEPENVAKIAKALGVPFEVAERACSNHQPQ